MGHWNTRGLRGSTLEEMINLTNDRYKEKGLALIQKIPTPITPVRIDSSNHTISLAYFDQQSTVDYIGAVQGIPVCFDAKETRGKNLPLRNIHEHQIEFMRLFQNQKGLAFLIVYFESYREYYFLSLDKLCFFFERSKNGGRKSIAYEEFDRRYLIHSKSGFIIHYLEAINTYFSEKDINGL